MTNSTAKIPIVSVQMPWGEHRVIASRLGYYGARLFVKAGAELPPACHTLVDKTVYVHAGKVHAKIEHNSIAADGVLDAGRILVIPPATKHAFIAEQDSVLLVVASSDPSKNEQPSIFVQKEVKTLVLRKPYDFFERYWGSIVTIINERYCSKMMVFEPNQGHSLHYHISKDETFYVESGKVRVRLRDRLANDHEIIVEAGCAIHIPPGLMHQIHGIERSVIFECSTKTDDEDMDTFRVEKGKGFKMTAESHPQLPSQEGLA